VADNRLNKSRLGRASRIGGVAAGAAIRNLGVRAANTRRTEEEAEDALGREALEMADRIVKVLGGMKGAAMKVGQTLSVLDPGLVSGKYRDEFQAKLAQLQTMAPPVAFNDMRAVIEEDLGMPLSAAFADFEQDAIAAASIGQVFRATIHDGRGVAVKVQYPGIKDAFARTSRTSASCSSSGRGSRPASTRRRSPRSSPRSSTTSSRPRTTAPWPASTGATRLSSCPG
jgi:predicted unusual protein kinase regulating ubiquinone biosynthesis (AarF/ABC1/UbiB family)